MVKILKTFKKEYLKRIISFIVLEAFIISFGMNNLHADDNKNNEIKRTVKLNLYYSFDETNNLLKLRWNKGNIENEKFYVFMKKDIKDHYTMISNKNGITEDNYITTLNDNKDSYFLVCTTDKIAKLPDDINIVSGYDMGEMVGVFKILRGCVYTESNEIQVRTDLNNREDLIEYAGNLNKDEEIVVAENNISKDSNDKKDEVIVDNNTNINNESIKEEEKVEEKKEDKVEEKTEDKEEKKTEDIKDDESDGSNKVYFFVDKNKDKKQVVIAEKKKDKDKKKKKKHHNNNNDNDNDKKLPDGFFPLDDHGPTHIGYKGVTIDVEKGSAPRSSYVYVKLLRRGEINKTPKDSPNVTYVDSRDVYVGYDITLNGDNGDTFTKNIKIGLKYDYTKSNGYGTKNSAFIYCYDNKAGWQYLARDNVDAQNSIVTSTTTHFCQFYTGLMTTPGEPPQAKGINTSPINIQAVDPMAGIRGLPSITPNNRGTAETSYPIAVPEGINNLTPNISINYSSESKEGNCGYGWNLGASSIEIKTKNKGVPKYDGNDILLLDGRELVKISKNEYRLKVEGGFTRIIKNADNGFIVYQTDGTILLYGQTKNSRLYDKKNESMVFAWYVSTVMDKFGNTMLYEYRDNKYISCIRYGYNNCYTILFDWKDDRPDKRESYIAGFLIESDLRLNAISINYKNQLLKYYILTYSEGAFGKSLLDSIEERNGDTTLLNKVVFEYDKDIDEYFGKKEEWDYSKAKEENLPYGTTVAKIDINGDGLVDRFFYDNYKYEVSYNQGEEKKSYSDKVDLSKVSQKISLKNNEQINGKDFFDYNNDGLIDIKLIIHRIPNGGDTTYFEKNIILYNTGNGFIAKENTDLEDAKYGDINGDNKLDMFESGQFTPPNYPGSISCWYVNIAKEDNTYDIKYPIESKKLNPTGYSFASIENLIDINGDGLVDNFNRKLIDNGYNVYPRYTQISSTEICKDKQFYVFNTFKYEEGIQDIRKYRGYLFRNNYKQMDINNDGLFDLVKIDNGKLYVALNTGTGFMNYTEWKQDFGRIDSTIGSINYNGFVDYDGDGLPDASECEDNIKELYVYKNLLKGKNLLKKITNAMTGTYTALEYAKFYHDPNREITNYYANSYCLSKIITGNNELNVSTYLGYNNGVYDRVEHEFRGFKDLSVTVIDNDKPNVANITYSTYLVDAKTGVMDCYGVHEQYDQYIKGQVDTVIKYVKINDDYITLSKEKYEYNRVNTLYYNGDVQFIYPSKVTSWIYNYDKQYLGKNPESQGDVTKESSYVIDTTYGLITQSTQTGYNDPYKKNDDIKTITNYSNNVTRWLSLPVNTETIDVLNGSRISYKTIEYYPNGAVLNETQWNNNGVSPKTIFTYDSMGNVNKITDDLTKLETNMLTEYEKEGYYKVVTKTTPDGLKETSKIDGYGRTKESIDVYDDKTVFNYDNYNRIISIQENIDGVQKTTKTFSYGTISRGGNIYFKAEANYLDDLTGNGYIRMQFIKDSLGRNVQTKKESWINENKCWTVSGYIRRDKMGRAVEVGVPTTADYNNEGIIDNENKSLEYSTKYEYDNFGRFSRATMPAVIINGVSKEYYVTKEYDIKVGNEGIEIVDIIKDCEGRMNMEYKDMLGNVIRSVTKAEKDKEITTSFEYDLHGNAKLYESGSTGSPTGSTGSGQAGSPTGEKQYDSLGRLMWMRSPDAGKFAYTYNDKGLVTKVTDYGKNETDSIKRETNYEYNDPLYRMTDIKYTDTSCNIKYEYYDNTGEGNKYARSNIKSISKGDYFKVQYKFGQLWIEENKTIEGSSYNTKYEYDVQGRINRLTYPDGESIIYAYDEGGYLNKITNTKTSYDYIENIKYNEYGQRTYVKYGNGTETSYTYDPANNMLDKMKVNKDAVELLSYDYDFDLTGNLTKLTNGSISIQEYEYDLLGRIKDSNGTYTSTSSKCPSSSYKEEYIFDDDNKMTKKVKDGTTYSFTYLSNTHAIDNITISGSKTGSIDFNYDDYGNLLSKVTTINSLKETTDFKYNGADQLINMKLPDGFQLDFLYDSSGQRIKKVYKDNVSAITSTIYVNGFYDIKDGNINKHVSDGQYIIASMIDNKAENILYYTQNNIGSTSMLTNNKGEKVQLYLFTPYGEPWITEDPVVDVERKFTGHIYDKESKLYYMNARYMDPEVGIFITPDPAMDGLNHYAYCSANPITYVDPTGLEGEGGGPGSPGSNGPGTGGGITENGPPAWCSYWSTVGAQWGFNANTGWHGKATAGATSKAAGNISTPPQEDEKVAPVKTAEKAAKMDTDTDNVTAKKVEGLTEAQMGEFNNKLEGFSPFVMKNCIDYDNFGKDISITKDGVIMDEHHPGIDYSGFDNLVTKGYLKVNEIKNDHLFLNLIGTDRSFEIIHLDQSVLKGITKGQIFAPNDTISPHPKENNGYSYGPHVEIRAFVNGKLCHPETGIVPKNLGDFYTRGRQIITKPFFQVGKYSLGTKTEYKQKWYETFK